MNLKYSRACYMGGFGRRKWKEKILYYNLNNFKM